MKKIILSLLLIVTIGIAGGVYYVLTNLNSLVKTAIETHGSEATKTSVGVEKVNIDLIDGAAGFSGLSIANPSGYSLPDAFSLGEIRAGIDLNSLQEEPYIINEITVLAPKVFVEVNEDNKTNLNQLKENLLAGVSSTSTSESSESTDQDSSSGPRLILRRVKFADGAILARVAALENKEISLELPGLEMTSLGGTQGATGADLAKEIVKRLADHATKQVKKEIIDKELAKLKAKAQAKVDEEKAKLGAKVEAEKQEQKEKVKDKLKSLLDK